MIKYIPQVTYKIYIPFHFGIGNKFYKTDLTINEFHIDDVHIKMHLDEYGDEENSYLIATTNVEEDGSHHIEDISDAKVGKCVQSFFDGISKGLSNAAFFNVYNGDDFAVAYEVFCDGWSVKTPYRDSNKGYYLDDELVNKAIDFANSKDYFLKQAFIYLKEGEYLVDIGRFNNAIIQFAIMIEYLIIINYQLNKKGMLKDNGSYKEPFKSECEFEYYKQYPHKNKKGIRKNDSWIPFYYSKYVYGLKKLGLKMDSDIIEAIDNTYKLRNKLAHGYDIYEAFKICDIVYENEPIAEYNIWMCMVVLSNYMTDVYNFLLIILRCKVKGKEWYDSYREW